MMKNYKVAGILVTLLPVFKDNDYDMMNAEEIRDFDVEDIDPYLYEEWKEDPYFTLIFLDENNDVINFNGRTICRIYMNRAEYKEVDINTDLILTLPLLAAFLNLFRENMFGFSYMDYIVNYTHTKLLERFGESIFTSNLQVPHYDELPVIVNGAVNYIYFRGVDSYE